MIDLDAISRVLEVRVEHDVAVAIEIKVLEAQQGAVPAPCARRAEHVFHHGVESCAHP